MEHKTKILAMLAEGKIDVSEAEKLLNAVDSKESPKREFSETAQRFFNILIDSKKDEGTRVKIKVPLRLIKAGMKFASLIPEESRKKIQIAMRDKGINFDLNELDSLNVDELLDALQTLEVAVNDSETSETIRIFCA
jgi:hypothetical protein